MRFAYADPPYLGMCSEYGHEHGAGGCWDDLATHEALIARLSARTRMTVRPSYAAACQSSDCNEKPTHSPQGAPCP